MISSLLVDYFLKYQTLLKFFLPRYDVNPVC